jgi:hypothetical protein
MPKEMRQGRNKKEIRWGGIRRGHDREGIRKR